MNTPELRSLLEIARQAAHRAGVAILEVYNAADAPDVRHKADDSPVTRADERADAIIVEMLRAAAPGIPVIAEETAEREGLPGAAPPRFWLVDPLDGTKEFLKRNGEFTVNIALVDNGLPVLGVVLAPATGATFVGGPDGAFEITNRDEHLPLRTMAEGPMKVVASRSHGHAALDGFC